VSHKDLPSPEANWWGSVAQDEVFFAVDEVVAHGLGQPIGIIAQKAARAVEVLYEDLDD
jgi:xanthine dehydrogenase/oxidase